MHSKKSHKLRMLSIYVLERVHMRSLMILLLMEPILCGKDKTSARKRVAAWPALASSVN